MLSDRLSGLADKGIEIRSGNDLVKEPILNLVIGVFFMLFLVQKNFRLCVYLNINLHIYWLLYDFSPSWKYIDS
jgi:hypothetical protein